MTPAAFIVLLGFAAFVLTEIVRFLRSEKVREVNFERDFREDAGRNLSELGGLSQSNHFGAIGHNEVRNHVA